MQWDPAHLRSVPSVAINHGAYEPVERRLAVSLASEAAVRAGGDPVMLDVGANGGYYALCLARTWRGDAGRLYAFEPVPETYRELQQNILLNDGMQRRIEALPVALGCEAGDRIFHVPAFHGPVAASARPLFPEGPNTQVAIRMETLDGFAESRDLTRLDFIKCDVEGGERDFVQGGLKCLRRFRPWLMLELLRKWSAVFGYHPNEVLETLSGLGYRCFSVSAGQITEHRDVSDTCPQTNFFFLPDADGDAPLHRAVSALPKTLR